MVMRMLPGRATGSLSHCAERHLKPWRRAGAEDQRRSSVVELGLLYAAAHPWQWIAAGVLSWALVAFLFVGAARTFGWSLYVWGRNDLPTYFGTVWAVQATVVALVYPLVVSFVGLLLQRRVGAKVALTGYLLETGVKASGISAFALLLLMTAQYIVLPWLLLDDVQAVVVASTCWLGVNLLLTGRFLALTARYLVDDRSIHTLKWMTQCMSLPREAKQRTMGLLLQNAQRNGWMPGRIEADEDDQPRVLVFPMGRGRAVVEFRSATVTEAVDIYLRPLSWAAHIWLRSSKERQLNGVLELPCVPFHPSREHVLSRLDGPAVQLGLPAKALVQAAYDFRATRSPVMPFSTLEILEELSQEASAQLQARNEPRLELALQDLLNVHAGVLNAAAYEGADGALESVAMLSEPYGFGSQRLSSQWMRCYRPFLETSVNSLDSGTDFVGDAANITLRLVTRVRRQPPEILSDLLFPASLMLYLMGKWWAKQAAKDLSTTSPQPIYLAQPLRNVYREAVRTWIGAWESIFLPDKKKHDGRLDRIWQSDTMRVRFYADHLDDTAMLLLAAVARSDAEAARGLADSLVKWWGRRSFDLDGGRPTLDRDEVEATLVMAEQPWHIAQQRIPNLPEGSEAGIVVRRLLQSTLKRYWSDVCLVVVLTLLDQAAEDGADSLGAEIALAVLEGREYEGGGTRDFERIRSVGGASAKIAMMQFLDHAYARRLDRIVERYRNDSRPPIMAGRVYSFSGSDDVDTLVRGQTLLFTILAQPRAQQHYEVNRLVERWKHDLSRLDRVQRHFKTISDFISGTEFDPLEPLAEALRDKAGRPQVADQRALAAEACSEISNLAGAAHQTVVEGAEVSAERLLQFAEEAEQKILNSREGSLFPLGLVEAFEETHDDLDVSTQVFSGVSKLPFTPHEVLDASLIDWLSEYAAKNVCARAVLRLVESREVQPVRDDRAESFYADLLKRIGAVKESGLDPVVLLGNGQRTQYLSPYPLDEDAKLPDGVEIRPPPPGIKGLYSVVNGTDVYMVPMLGTRHFVVPKDWLRCVQFKRYPTGFGVSAEVQREKDGKLDLAVKVACRFEGEIS